MRHLCLGGSDAVMIRCIAAKVRTVEPRYNGLVETAKKSPLYTNRHKLRIHSHKDFTFYQVGRSRKYSNVQALVECGTSTVHLRTHIAVAHRARTYFGSIPLQFQLVFFSLAVRYNRSKQYDNISDRTGEFLCHNRVQWRI